MRMPRGNSAAVDTKQPPSLKSVSRIAACENAPSALHVIRTGRRSYFLRSPCRCVMPVSSAEPTSRSSGRLHEKSAGFAGVVLQMTQADTNARRCLDRDQSPRNHEDTSRWKAHCYSNAGTHRCTTVIDGPGSQRSEE